MFIIIFLKITTLYFNFGNRLLLLFTLLEILAAPERGRSRESEGGTGLKKKKLNEV